MEIARLPADEVRAALSRVLGSRAFARATSLSNLLRYIVEMTETGQTEKIKEYTIALEVFGRASYDPQVDSLVRVEAGKLRKRLASYYETEGSNDPVRIEIPKGSYVPAFRETRIEPPARPSRRYAVVAAAVLVTASIGLAVWRLAPAPRPVPQPAGTVSMAVLSFVDLSPARDGQHLCDGLTEELITRLAGVEALRVASHTSILQYKGQSVDVRRIGDVLKVKAVLEGSVRIEAGRIRVHAQLVDTADGFHLWSSTIDEAADSPDVQRKIADAVFRSFHRELKPTRRALVRPHSRNPDARHYYMRGVRLGFTEPLKAVELYQAAVAADPGYALAWASLALSLLTALDWGEARPSDLLPRAAEAARRALAIDSTIAEAHQAVARLKVFQEQDWLGAEKAFEHALELDPAHVQARHDYVNVVLIPTGRFAEAVDQLQRAIVLNPGDNTLHNALASAYVKARQYAHALPPLEASQKISATAPGAWVLRGIVAIGRDDLKEALRCFEIAVSRARTAFTLSHLGYAYARLGRKEDASKVIAELEQVSPGKPTYKYEEAMIHAGLSDKDSAFAALDRAVVNQEQGLLWINVDYRVDELRPDPRLGRLLKRMRLE